MTNSQFIASLIGPTLVAISCSVLLNKNAFQDLLSHLEDNMFVIFLVGIALLVSGISIVRLHDVWEGWPVIITLFGWLAIFGGLVRIVFAPRLQGIGERIALSPTTLTVAIVVNLLLGLYLTGKGFALI